MIIFLYGPDTFRSRQKLEAMVAKFKKDVDPSGLNIEQVDGVKLENSQLTSVLFAPPFMAKKRLVVVKNLLGENKGQKIFTEILETIETKKLDDVVLIFWEGESLEKRKMSASLKKLLTRLKQEKFKEQFDLLTNSELAAWTKQELARRGGEIEPAALNLLLGTTGNNLWRLNGEIDKLIACAAAKPITRQMVEDLTEAKLEDNIFKLTDAVAEKHSGVALKLIEEALASGITALELLNKIAWQYRILLMIKNFSENFGPAYSPQRIASQLKLHPFVVKKSLQQSQRHSEEFLKNQYLKLQNIDRNIKTSQADPRVLLDLLVLAK